MTDEVILYWRMIVTTLRRRGLLRERLPSGEVVVPEADAYVLPERVVFLLHPQHTGGVSREEWLDRRLWAQWQASLAGRRVFISHDGSLAITVSRNPAVRESALEA
jgi:hypothetical protein